MFPSAGLGTRSIILPSGPRIGLQGFFDPARVSGEAESALAIRMFRLPTVGRKKKESTIYIINYFVKMFIVFKAL